MIVAMVVPALGFVGGIERFAYNFAVGLRERGHECVLVHGDGVGKNADEYMAPFSRAMHTRDAGRLGEEGIADLVYVHRADTERELLPYAELPTLVASHDHRLTCPREHRYLPVTKTPCHRAPGASCVTHGCVVVRDRSDGPLPVALKNPFALRREVQALAKRATLVACSHYIRTNLVGAGVPFSRTAVLHPIPRETDLQLKPRPRSSKLLFVGQLLTGKGVDIAIDALRFLPQKVTLTIAGDGPSREALERLADKAAKGRVRFLGYQTPEAIDRVYDEANTVVVPSRWPEPFGMIGIEAMRRGRPVVASAHGGIPEWLTPGRGGLLFEPGSAEGLAQAARALLEDESAGARALDEARERFSFARFMDEAEGLLNATLHAHRTGTRP